MSFLYLDLIGLGNWPHILDNGPHLSPLGRFVLWDVLSLGTFCRWDVLSLGRFVYWDVLSSDVLYVHQSYISCSNMFQLSHK